MTPYQLDKRWFLANRPRNIRIRPPEPGELPELPRLGDMRLLLLIIETNPGGHRFFAFHSSDTPADDAGEVREVALDVLDQIAKAGRVAP